MDETGLRQNLGLLDKVANKLEIDAAVTVHGHIDMSVSETKLEALTAMLISEVLEAPPEEVLQMSGRSPVFIDAPLPQSCLTSLGGLEDNTPRQMPHRQPFSLDPSITTDGEILDENQE